MFHIAIFEGLEFLGEEYAPQSPCGHGTGYQQTSISKSVLVQPLPSCTIISISALFNKSLNHSYKHIVCPCVRFETEVLASNSPK